MPGKDWRSPFGKLRASGARAERKNGNLRKRAQVAAT